MPHTRNLATLGQREKCKAVDKCKYGVCTMYYVLCMYCVCCDTVMYNVVTVTSPGVEQKQRFCHIISQ